MVNMRHRAIDFAISLFLLLTFVTGGLYYLVIVPTYGIVGIWWYCNLALLLGALAFVIKSRLLLSTLLIVTIPTQFFWIVADVMRVLGLGILHRSAWLTIETNPLVFILNFNYHFAIIPICIYGIWKYGYDRRAFLGAVVFLMMIMFGTRLLTTVSYNVNCVYYPCDIPFNEPGAKDQGWLYTIWRCGYFIFFSGILHLVCFKVLPKKRLIHD